MVFLFHHMPHDKATAWVIREAVGFTVDVCFKLNPAHQQTNRARDDPPPASLYIAGKRLSLDALIFSRQN